MIKLKTVICGSASILLGLLGTANCFADDVYEAAIRQGQSAEAQGNLMVAYRQYYNIADSYGSRDYGAMPIEVARLCGRRSLALAIVLYKQNNPAISAKTVNTNYVLMRKLEPGNGTWAYLMAQWGLKNGFWDQVPQNLKVAFYAPDTPDSIRIKARNDYKNYVPQIMTALEAERKDQDLHFDQVAYQRQLERMATFQPSFSTPDNRRSNSKDPWHDPSNNATAAGDYAAADRLMSGNGTSRDVGLYMH